MKKTVIYIVLSTFLFSSMEIALKIAGATFNPIQLNLIRFFIGSLILLPIANKSLKQKEKKLKRKDWELFVITGFIFIIVSMTLFQLAVTQTKASTVAVLFSCNPVFALLFAYVILHEKMNRISFISVILSLIGLLIIVNPTHLNNPNGIILSLLSAVTFAFYSIVSRYASKKLELNGVVMTCYTFIAGTIELFIIAILSHTLVIIHTLYHTPFYIFADLPVLKHVTIDSLPLLIYLGICVTGGGFAFYFLAMEYSDVSTASLVFFIKPALAPILAMLIIHEKISLETFIGISVIILGSLVSFVGNRSFEKQGLQFKHRK